MRLIPLFPAALAVFLTSAACSEAQSDETTAAGTSTTEQAGKSKKKKKKDSLESRMIDAAVPGLRRVGRLDGVSESSGLALGPQAGSYFTFGDNGNVATLYQIDGTGSVTSKVDVGAKNKDWESLTRDPQGNYFIGDCGNNNSDRRDLRLLRLNPANPQQIGTISFTYPDQNEFPPKKKQRNFDCEATLWHEGKVWLFTKDPQEQTSNVYTVSDQPGTHTATRAGSIAIPGQVTDAALSPSGRRLVLLGRGELFILDGSSWADILKATPRQVDLQGAGQTEGAEFKDENTLVISTEEGNLYEFTMP
ncbi:hypothetical protein I2I05_05420 [Hymenobacter sp. BT683]|uniref:Uncharacterized protein n=1 Tax=Hymenobacter jeongseonensis TaxID=2791027 RepID=A0ABS0IEQ1_9BACT|nr:hypothetical protein [Hymenobacter jeongseonensis]MBF9236829.1 hypothetical protein [Hymenobacter jeongseonensis]